MRPPSVPTTIPINKDDGKQTVIMKSLYNCLIEHREPKTHRILIQLFMCLPSREDFPDYFKIIEKPIAMNKIREKIDRQIYPDENSCMEDFKLMFSNCKFFNEDDSKIYQDAVTLENILKKKREQLHIEYNRPSRDSKDATKEAILNSYSNETTTTATPPATSVVVAVPDSHNKKTDSTNHSTNGNDKVIDSSRIKMNHNHHNETSMDSSSNLSAELIANTPIEKCSLNTRRGRNPEAPKRQLLTGYIIYASEIRKQVIDKNPNQNFGDISRLVGNEWKALPYDIRSKYDQRALIHNKRVRERAQRESLNNSGATDTSRLSNGLHTPKMTKRKLAKLAKEQMRQHHLSISGLHDETTSQSPRMNQDLNNQSSNQKPSSTYKNLHHQHSQPQTHTPSTSFSKVTTVETSTQTTAIRFVEPPTKKRLVYSETFRKYIESLQVPNKGPLAEEMTAELPTQILGAGIGRHESPEAALWALRDFMLQDAVTMRRSMEPYL